MQGRLLFIFIFYPLMLLAQTYDWVYLSQISSQTNPAYWRSIVVEDKESNPVYANPINKKGTYSTSYLGDVQIVKRNPAGNIIWADTIIGKIDVSSLVCDNNNNIIFVFAFRDTIFVNGQQFIHNDNASYFGNLIIKYSSAGIILWVEDRTNIYPALTNITSLDVDHNNNIWVAGISNNLQSYIYMLSPAGSGVMIYIQQNVRTIASISVDTDGNLWVSGSTFTGSVSFNGYNTTVPFNYSNYLVKYNPYGFVEWVNFVEDITLQDWHIVTDNYGNGYLAGSLFTGTTFGNLQANGPQWVMDFFVTKVSPDGNFIWLREIPPGNNLGDGQMGNVLPVACRDDAVFITGLFRGTLNMGNSVNLQAEWNVDMFVLKYSSDGDVKWGKTAGGSFYDFGSSVSVDNRGNIYVTGTAGPNPVFNSILPADFDHINIFIAKITGDVVIPVELSSFEAICNENTVTLKWSTSSEINNHGFEIDRASSFSSQKRENYDGWEKIAFVEGYGTTVETVSYSFVDKNLKPGSYAYRLKQIDFDGSFEYSSTIKVDVASHSEFHLSQNYPNPFNPSTTINFQLPYAGNVSLKVYDILGNEIVTLVDEYKPAGRFEVEFIAGQTIGLSSGVYFYTLLAGGFTQTKRLLLMK